MAKFHQGEGVPNGANPLGIVQETPNGTVINGGGDDGYLWGGESTIQTGRNSVQPPPPVEPDFGVEVVVGRRRK